MEETTLQRIAAALEKMVVLMENAERRDINRAKKAKIDEKNDSKKKS